MGRLKKSLLSLIDRAGLARVRAQNTLREMGLPLDPPALLVFHPGYLLPRCEDSFRPAFDGRRSTRILEELRSARLLSPSLLLTPQEVSAETLSRVHSADFLEELADPRRMAELIFVPADRMGERDFLRPFLLQTGGTVLALQRALSEDVSVFNLGGGFHHAQRDRAEGFCPVNDVAVAIRCMQQGKPSLRVLVVDLDYHQGNGTAQIFEDDESVFTLSIHGRTWSSVVGKRNNLDQELPAGVKDDAYLETVRQALDTVLGDFRPHVALYLAGTDIHEEDSLGDFAISEDGVLRRDLHVWRVLQDAGIPVVVLLAGGYGPMTWTLSYNFIHSVFTGQWIHRKNRPSNIQARYRRIRRSLTPFELRAGEESLTEESLEDFLMHRSTGGLFMDQYTREGLEIALQRYGFLDLLRERGFSDLEVSVETEDPQRQIARIHFDQQDPEHLLVELVVRFCTLMSPAEALKEGAEDSYRMLSIEWLLMQDPTAHFSLERRKLPGQEHPGLGLGRWMVELLRMMAERLDCTGLMNIPQHYHNAFLYSKQMLCFHPEDQGYLEALKRDLGHLPLVETSEAIDQGRLCNTSSGELRSWEGKAQVMPVRRILNKYFTRPGYIKAVSTARDSDHFKLVDNS